MLFGPKFCPYYDGFFYVSLIWRVGVAVDKYLKIYSIWMLMALFQKFISETSLIGEFPRS